MRAVTLLLLPMVAIGCKSAPDLPGEDGDADGGLGTGGGTGGAAGVDESRLDRSVDEGPCGYPGPGPNGYGTEVGERVANTDGIEIIDCEGNELQLADFFCERDDDYGDYNRAILLNIGAGWCAPCQEETQDELPELYEELHDQGVEFVQIMFQDWDALNPTKSFCSDWKSGTWRVGMGGEEVDLGFTLEFPVLLDRTNDFMSIYMSNPQAQTPINILMDANANIRWVLAGEKPANLRQQIELVMSSPYEP